MQSGGAPYIIIIYLMMADRKSDRTDKKAEKTERTVEVYTLKCLMLNMNGKRSGTITSIDHDGDELFMLYSTGSLSQQTVAPPDVSDERWVEMSPKTQEIRCLRIPGRSLFLAQTEQELTLWDSDRAHKHIENIMRLSDQCKYFVCKESRRGITEIMVMTKQKKLVMYSLQERKFVQSGQLSLPEIPRQIESMDDLLLMVMPSQNYYNLLNTKDKTMKPKALDKLVMSNNPFIKALPTLGEFVSTSIGNLGIRINQAGDPCTKDNLLFSNQQIRTMSL